MAIAFHATFFIIPSGGLLSSASFNSCIATDNETRDLDFAVVLNAQQQVDNGLSTFLQSWYQVGFLRSSAQAASGALKIALEQYDQGATDFTTVLTAEQNLFQAESNLAVATANVPLGLTVVYRALGGGWQIREDGYFVDAATSE